MTDAPAAGTTVETVTGPVNLDALGATLMHEHVFTLNAELRDNYPWDEEEVVSAAVTKLSELKAQGVSTIVDLTVYGLGRDLARIARIAREAEFQIIVATGIYTYRDMPTYFAANEARHQGFIEDFFVREVEDGAGPTGIHPAIFKCATDTHGVTEDVETILRSVARAHRRTGVPISTHAHGASRQGLAQQQILEEEGVDLSRVIIGHVGDVAELDYAEELIARGSYIGLDRFGINLGGHDCGDPDKLEQRITIAAELCRRGHAAHLVLGHDTNVESDTTTRAQRATLPGLQQWRYTYIYDEVLPALLKAGVSGDDIDQMLVRNPATIFGHTGAY